MSSVHDIFSLLRHGRVYRVSLRSLFERAGLNKYTMQSSMTTGRDLHPDEATALLPELDDLIERLEQVREQVAEAAERTSERPSRHAAEAARLARKKRNM